MSEEEVNLLPRITRVIRRTDIDFPERDFLDRVNTLTDLGYQLKSGSFDYAWLYLPIEKYHDVTNLKDVPSDDVDSYLADGWEIASASISTKFIRMVKRSG